MRLTRLAKLGRLWWLAGLALAAPGVFAQSQPPTPLQGRLEHNGLTRTYELRLPPPAATPTTAGAGSSQGLPLVIAMHGGGGWAKQFEASAGLTAFAAQAGFAVVYPNGASGPFGAQVWAAGACCGTAAQRQVDDVGFIARLIDELAERHGIDPQRVLVTGHSNGGMMAWRLACELSERITAAVPNASVLVMPTCTPKRPVPVLVLHSSQDRNVPLAGGRGIGPSGVAYPSLADALALTAAANGCQAKPEEQAAGPAVRHQVWVGCKAGAALEFMLTQDGGHSWPGGEPGRRWVGDVPSKAIRANEVIWDFFKKQWPR